MLGVVDYFLHDISKAMHRISVGEIPDGSGDPIGDAKLSDIYFVLLGRPGNQVAHGGQSAAGTLTLASTTHATKGFIYLGNAQDSAYDEVNERLGINEAAPDARLHLKHAVGGGTQSVHPINQYAGSWGVSGGNTLTALAANDGDTTIVQSDDDTPGAYIEFTMTKPSDPGIYTGWVLHVICRKTAVTTVINGRLDIYKNRVYAGTYSGGTLVESVASYFSAANNSAGLDIAIGYADLYYNLSAADAAEIAGCTSWSISWTDTGSWTAGNVKNITEVYLECPGLLSATPLQKWENTTLSNELNYVADALGSTTLQLSGTPKFRITSGLELDIGTPVVGYLWSATDTEGTGAWAAASGLPTRVVNRWTANGPYRDGVMVDGAMNVPGAMTISQVRLYRRAPGTAGTTTVDLLKNGTSIMTAPPAIAFGAGASAVAVGTVNAGLAACVAGDILSANVTAETGGAQDWCLTVMGA